MPLDAFKRDKGFKQIREAIAEFGIDDDAALLVTGDTQLFDMEYNAARQLLQAKNRPMTNG